MAKLNLDVWGETDVGLKRESNQDSFLIDEELGLYVIADGMGGHMGGEVASKMAVEAVRSVIRDGLGLVRSSLDVRDLLLKAFKEASHRIFDKSMEDAPELKGMGTTLVAALHFSEELFIGNVGDSRAYLMCLPFIWQITEDHSLLNEQIRAGLLREEDADRFGGKNVITRSVGFERDVECDIVERHLQHGDQILMCSDGLTGLVSDEDIAEICAKYPAKKVVPKCIEEAKKRGGDDNVTVMFLSATQ